MDVSEIAPPVPSNPRKRCSGSGSTVKSGSHRERTASCASCGRTVSTRRYRASSHTAQLIAHRQPTA